MTTMEPSIKMYGGGGGKLVVKNKTPNPVQITAEQLLREAVERQQQEVKAPRQRIVDEDELEEYRVRKRKEYEDALRRQRHNIGIWIRYAEWEGAQRDFRRARSVYERALVVEFHNIGLWAKYIAMETKNKFVNSARNLYDRVTQLLPRVDQFWIKYTHMEELLGNYAGARAVFERWMAWEPEDKSWMMYIRFEERCQELDRARAVFERYLSCRPSQESFLKFSKFEERHRNIARARAGYEKAIEVLPEESLSETFYIKFAQFEERQKEFDRVKGIFEQALARCSQDSSEELYRKFVSFQKQRGDREALEKTVIDKRRVFYEELLLKNPKEYDTWFDLLRLEELVGDIDRTRDTYERAVAQVPPLLEKRHWRRYIYLWINYALFEELISKDVDRTRAVYDKVLQIIPHRKFSFSKIWIYYAEFEVRQLQLDRVRRIFGRAIGECGKEKIFTAYAGLELGLGNIERCRKIHAKFIETHPSLPKAWISMVDFEVITEETERARALCEIAISMDIVDMPELIWKRYIDLESELGQLGRARDLYDRLLEKTKHFKAFKAYSTFEYEKCGNIKLARDVLERGIQYCKDNKLNEERKFLVEHWLALEKQNGDKEAIARVTAMKPKAVRIRKTIIGDDGTSQGFEEVIEYLFKDDLPQAANLKILEKAKAWKKSQQSGALAT